ncbi:hypothetical protein K474DRAFT_1664331 [Panus rudis PR-1116 ss-1]|nr:hypothetical protein K474DRAFT_1664331 [Panus rudis PR-1116 ss-1]
MPVAISFTLFNLTLFLIILFSSSSLLHVLAQTTNATCLPQFEWVREVVFTVRSLNP